MLLSPLLWTMGWLLPICVFFCIFVPIVTVLLAIEIYDEGFERAPWWMAYVRICLIAIFLVSGHC